MWLLACLYTSYNGKRKLFCLKKDLFSTCYRRFTPAHTRTHKHNMSNLVEPTRGLPSKAALDRLNYAKLLLSAYAEQQKTVEVYEVDDSGCQPWVILLPPNVHLTRQTFKEFRRYAKELGFDVNRRAATEEEKEKHRARFNFTTYFTLCRPCNPRSRRGNITNVLLL